MEIIKDALQVERLVNCDYDYCSNDYCSSDNCSRDSYTCGYDRPCDSCSYDGCSRDNY